MAGRKFEINFISYVKTERKERKRRMARVGISIREFTSPYLEMCGFTTSSYEFAPVSWR